MNSIQDIKPISYVKANTTEVLSTVNSTKRPMYVTQNGIAKAVILDPDSFENMKKALAMLKLLAIGEEELKNGKFSKQNDVFAEIESKHKWIK
ncbi:MAG TPA: type II toxin-antitoxin system Phd/YefM family antitoxin [Spirochaetota bacterium]|nr:type II toxin-antitoxin system Phd/YefM family antitoxin [Spirochaetota bacterium]HQE59614.1 type II toxin-antitoxin system Phd/YefM family antitoxin [Spirochaetota bacterium]